MARGRPVVSDCVYDFSAGAPCVIITNRTFLTSPEWRCERERKREREREREREENGNKGGRRVEDVSNETDISEFQFV